MTVQTVQKLIALAQVFLPMVLAYPAAAMGKRSKKCRFLPALALCLTETALCIFCLLEKEQTLTFSPFLMGGLSLSCGGFGGIYAFVASFMWTVATLFSPMYFEREEASGRYIFSWLMTLGATVGMFLSQNLVTAFLFFEILSLCSYIWVVEERTPSAFDAGKTYLAVAVLGGMVLFFGLTMLQVLVGTTDFSALPAACAACEKKTQLTVAGLFILFGFGAKAGMFPLHIWLPKAHPVAPSPASALLSGVLTKAGIFGIIVLCVRILGANMSFGQALIFLGTVTMVLGALLALASVNLKRTLACSSVSQIGFILVGLGCGQALSSLENGEEGAALAFSGSFLHMLNHSALKLALFLCAGVVAAKAGSLQFDDIRGFGRKKPLLCAVFLVGCLGIGGVPFFNGYVSKTLLHEGLVQLAALTGRRIYTFVEWLFLFSGGMTVCYMAKLFTVLFIDKHPQRQKQFEDTKPHLGVQASAALALCLPAVLCMGILPFARILTRKGASFFLLSEQQGEELTLVLSFRKLFAPESLSGAGISLCIGAVLFVAVVLGIMRRKGGYRDLKPKALDLEELLYRPLCKLGLLFLDAAARLFDLFDGTALLFSLSLLRVVCMLFELFDGVILLLSRWFNPSRGEKPGWRVNFERRAGAASERFLHWKDGYGKVKRLRFTFENTVSMVSRSFAFTMTMTCLGLCMLFLYMILF